MKQRTFGVDVITPQQGNYLTQKNLEDENSRIFSGEVWLSPTDSASNWIEVSNEYKEQWETEHPAKAQDKTIYSARNIKCAELDNYDKSIAVNLFRLNGVPMWLPQETRIAVLNRLTAEEMAGKTQTTLWYNGQTVTIGIATCRQMLYALELYASQCYDTTEQHRNNIRNLTTIEEIEAYDFTTGYPDKLEFSNE